MDKLEQYKEYLKTLTNKQLEVETIKNIVDAPRPIFDMSMQEMIKRDQKI